MAIECNDLFGGGVSLVFFFRIFVLIANYQTGLALSLSLECFMQKTMALLMPRVRIAKSQMNEVWVILIEYQGMFADSAN